MTLRGSSGGARRPRLHAAPLALCLVLGACASPPPPPAPPPRAPAGLTAWKALDWYSRALEETRDPREKAAILNRMGSLYLEVGRAERAREAYRRSQYLDPDGDFEGSNLAGVGRTYLEQGSPAPAVLPLREAVEKLVSDADRDEARALLAEALEASGRKEEAEAVRAGIVDPSRPGLAARKAGPPVAAPRTGETGRIALPTGGTSILPRARWGAAPISRSADPMGTPRSITVHHSAMDDPSSNLQDAIDEIRRIQKAHQRDEGWADIGYHFLIDGTGRLWEGRPLALQGAHAGSESANRGNVGICLLGDFGRTAPTPGQRMTLEALVAALRSKYSIPAGNVYTHREVRRRYGLGFTECPGANLQAVVERMRAAGVRSARAAGDSVHRANG